MFTPKTFVPDSPGTSQTSSFTPKTFTPDKQQAPQESGLGKVADTLGSVGRGILNVERKIPGMAITQDVGLGASQLIGKLFGQTPKQTAQDYSAILPQDTISQMGDHPISRVAKDVAGIASYPASKVPVIGNALAGGLTEVSREGATPGSVGSSALLSALLGPIVNKGAEGISGFLGKQVFGESGAKLPQIIEELGGAPIVGSKKAAQQTVREGAGVLADKAKSALGDTSVTYQQFNDMIEKAFPQEVINNLPTKDAHPLAEEKILLSNIRDSVFGKPLNEGVAGDTTAKLSDLYDQYALHNKSLGNSDAMKAFGSFLRENAQNPDEYSNIQGLRGASSAITSPNAGPKEMRLSPWLIAHLVGGLGAGLATGNVPAGLGATAALFAGEQALKNPGVALPLASLLAPGAKVIPQVENRAIQQALTRLGASGMSQLLFPQQQQQQESNQ